MRMRPEPVPTPPPTVELARCGSISAVAACWARVGGPLPRVFAAGTQAAGRGQWGRRWRSPAGGCWFTLALPADPPGRFPLRAAEAVRAGIEVVVGPRGASALEVVAPNDVLLGGRKVAGLLCERLAVPGGPGGRSR